MAKLEVKNITGAKDWYPCFSVTIKMTKEEYKKLPECFSKVRVLKDGTHKYHSSSQAGSGVDTELQFKKYTKILNTFGIEVQ